MVGDVTASGRDEVRESEPRRDREPAIVCTAEREQQAPTRRVVVGRERALQVRLVR